jgi:hypothetical protein
MLNPAERNVTNDLLTTLLDMVTSSDALFRMTKTQLQKESIDDRFKKYIIPATKTTPKIEKISMPSGRSTDHFEYRVTGSLASQSKTFKSKKEAQAYFNTVKESIEEAAYEDNMGAMENDYDETDGLSMAQIDVSNMIQDAEELLQMMEQMDEEPEAWVLSKITKAADYISSVRDYLEFEDDFDYEDGEEDGEEDEGMYNERMLTREYVEKVGNDWDNKSSMRTPGPVGSGTGDKAGQTSVDGKRSVVSTAKNRPTTNASAHNILQGGVGEGSNTGTSPNGKTGGLVGNVKGKFTDGGIHNVDGVKSGVKTLKGQTGWPNNNKSAGPVGSGSGDKAGQTSVTGTKSILDKAQ